MNQKQNDFDSFVRRLADEAEPPYREASWLRMEKLLDRKRKKRAAWWFWPVGLGLLFLAFILVYPFINRPANDIITIHSNPSEATKLPSDMLYSYPKAIQLILQSVFEPNELFVSPHDLNSTAPINRTENPAKINEITGSKPADQPSSKLATSKPYLPKPSPPSNQRKYNKVAGSSSNKINQRKGLAALASDQVAASNQNASRSAERNRSSNQHNRSNSTIPNEPSEPKNQIQADSEKGSLDIHPNSQLKYFVSMIPPGRVQLNLIDEALSIPSEPIRTLKTISHPSRQFSGFTLSANGGSEWSKVNSRSWGKDAIVRGGSLAYALGRWSIQTGVLWTTKVYTADLNSYAVPSGSYWEGKTIHAIRSSCTVLEWPVSFGYLVPIRRKNYFLLQAGLSSIRMNKENYGWEYSYRPQSPVIHREADFENKNWEWASSGLFSAGVFHRFSRHLSLGIQPYYQLPLTGIGAGNSKIRSFGGLVTLNLFIPQSRLEGHSFNE
jgi:hypothetical protein